MAPIYAAAVGISPQIIDDERLQQLRQALVDLEIKVPLENHYSSPDELEIPLDIDKLASIVEPWQSWLFEEQVDLQEWIQPLNKIDACLCYYIQRFPSMLLIGPVERTKSRGAVKAPDQLISKPAETMEEVSIVPPEVYKHIYVVVKFLSGLLLNASNKSIFNSVEELVDLLAAADDTIAAVALEALSCLATPPSLHKQQAPEVQQHSTALHNSRTTSHKRLIALARGWGTRGSGLGLYSCATADDSEFGQGALPEEAGELHFAFFRPTESTSTAVPSETENDIDVKEMDDSHLVRISLHKREIGDGSSPSMKTEAAMPNTSNNYMDPSKQKRRRVAPTALGEQSLRSTAELFFLCLQKAGGRQNIPDDRLFPLLADIRLTRSFHCHATRIAAVERRLRALITILHSHPSQEMMSGYFQAQPELCVELIDLLRPTVSSATVSAASSNPHTRPESTLNQDGMSALATSPVVPYEIRKLALESLTALVTRRDGTSGALTGVARHSNVLTELGVGKGQYLGLLPTLIRFSLASLGSLMSTDDHPSQKLAPPVPEQDSEEALALEVGLAFVEATAPPPLPRVVQLERALEFIDSVLTLTSAVVSTPSGTSALTECGLIPALLTTVAINDEDFVKQSQAGIQSEAEEARIKALVRFVTAQAVQILEGAMVTHSNALSAFHDLHGVEVLTTRLSEEILGFKGSIAANASEGIVPMEVERSDSETVGKMDIDVVAPSKSNRLQSSQRVLLFSIVTCLTVVFHQESTSSSVSAPSGATELRKDELTKALVEIMDNVDVYGGHLASLIATLMSDVMNSDPHVVHHVHESGLAKSFLAMFVGDLSSEPPLPPVPELIMALPNVLSALALTEDGANAIKEANPFPALLRLFYHPKYAMPRSRCLLNEMTAIVGTGLDEIMRHIPSLKVLIGEAIANAMHKVADMGKILSEKESQLTSNVDGGPASDLENERSCFMQYVLNFGQVLEQILHNEEHCEPFVNAGGLDAILKLHPYLMPTGTEFLSHMSCLSCPFVSTLAHSTTEDSLALAFKCIALRYNSLKLLQTMVTTVNTHLAELERSLTAMKLAFPSFSHTSEEVLDITNITEGLPREPIYAIPQNTSASDLLVLADFLRQVVTIQWVTNLLSTAIKGSCQRSQETGTGWSRNEREWKKELSSAAFEELVARLSRFHQSAIFEVCRIRTEDGFEAREKANQDGSKTRLHFRLRIVCPEGAVVRDGIEIDSCASIGSMEMGEITNAFDRCVNSSGILRYRTQRGWVSEQTRGHGREPIAEVLNVWEAHDEKTDNPSELQAKGRVESAVPDLCKASVNILARLQSSYAELFSSLSKVVIHGVRSLPVRTLNFQQGTIGAHVTSVMKTLSVEIMNGFNRQEVASVVLQSGSGSSEGISSAGIAMYLGCLLSHLHSSLFEEKRERRMINIPLLIALSNGNDWVGVEQQAENEDRVGFFKAISFIYKRSFEDFEERSLSAKVTNPDEKASPRQHVSRTTAASFPPATAILRRLISGPSVTSSPVSSVLSRIKLADLSALVGEKENMEIFMASDSTQDQTFSPEMFSRVLLCKVSSTVRDAWKDSRMVHAPPHITHPLSTLVGEIMVGLEDSTKKVASTPPSRSQRDDSGIWNAFRGMLSGSQSLSRGASSNEEEEFEPSEEQISRLMEMGFSRDHAWDAIDSTRSTQLEVAMEYALSHPPPTAAEIERRRAARQERRRARSGEQGASDPTASGRGQENGSGEEENQGPAQNDNAEDNNESMQVDSPPEPTEDKKPHTDGTITRARNCLEIWKLESSRVACEILAGLQSSGVQDLNASIAPENRKSEGDGEIEALTVVLSSFLLDLCQRYPDQRDRIATELLERLKSQIVESQTGEKIEYGIMDGMESSFAALCHGAVLFVRALPKLRILVLKEGLVNRVLSCVQLFLESSKEMDGDSKTAVKVKWPMWLASSLLLLDVMAQPVVAFQQDDKSEGGDSEASASSTELSLVKEEHRQQAKAISSLARDLMMALRAEKPPPSDPKASPVEAEESRLESSESQDADPQKKKPNDVSSESKEDYGFSSVPAYFPLLPSEVSNECIEMCLKLLESGSGSAPPPGVTHGALLLLMRLLRSPKLSSKSLKLGTAEKILALPRESRFTGHTGLVTLIMRRLLEDDFTLQAAMETEICGTITKLQGKRGNNSHHEKERPSVPRKAFVQAITPLLCRDPASFLKAVAVTVEFEKPESSSEAKVTLLSSAERARNLKIVADLTKPKESSKPSPHRRSSFGSKKRSSTPGGRSKTPTRSNKRGLTPKRSKKEKHDVKDKHEDDPKSQPSHCVGAAGQIISLLLNQILQQSSTDHDKHPSVTNVVSDFGYDKNFLWKENLLEILADLVLAIPSCATAIHKFKPRGRERHTLLTQPRHALQGCPHPPKTFVSFLLHCMLPQDRWSSSKDKQLWERENGDNLGNDEVVKSKKKLAFAKTKIAQSTARLLVALVARPGEGRRRVIAELVFALSGGQLGGASPSSPPLQKMSLRLNGNELHALQAWGELCIGLAAPRSNGSNYDGNSTLSFEVIKIMLEHGMAHALLLAVHRIPLFHQMATSTVSALVLPFEILTRPSVNDIVQTVVDKEVANKETKALSRAERQKTATEPKGSHDENPRHDSFADDNLLEDAFGGDGVSHSVEDAGIDASFDLHVDDQAHQHEFAGDDEHQVHEDEIHEHEMEIDDDDVDEEVSDDDEMSSSEESGESSEEESSGDEDEEEDDDEDDDEEEDDDEDSIIEESEGSNSVDQFVHEGDLDGDVYREEMMIDNQGYDEEGGADRGEPGIDEGWTRIESTGFGGALLGRGRPLHGMSGNVTARTRGFIDAAEAMIGTLLRTGEIHGDALAEIEGSLGIRITPSGRGLSMESTGRRETGLEAVGFRRTENNLNGNANPDVVGTLPQIHQRNQPDVGYAPLGGGGRWNEISSMEYVFGGPSITAGSRNYDLISPTTPEEDDLTVPTMSQLEGGLFPGGPSSATHARTQLSLHPLLCGIDLPPVNALVSDLLPHGVRATRRGQVAARRPGDLSSATFPSGGFLVSTSNGNIIRANRSATGGPISMTAGARGTAGPTGWTDDGLPFDATVEEFSSAFETALGQAMTTAAAQPDTSGPGENENDANGNDTESPNAAPGPSDVQMSEPASGQDVAVDEEPASSQARTNEPELADGDGVASSLATGLRLSSDNEASGGIQISAGDSDVGGPADVHMDDVQGSFDNDEAAREGHVQDATLAGATSEVGSGAADENPTSSPDEARQNENPEGDEEGPPAPSEQSTVNGLVCPPGMDPEVFSVLPHEMQQEVVDQAQAAAQVASQLDAGSSLDPEALAALPEEMRREVIEQDQRERRMREEVPADPANAEEMDNASFVASLGPELRNEILMTADDAFLLSLPPDIIAEAQILRERASVNRRAFEERSNHEAPAVTDATNQRSGQGGSGREPSAAGTGASSRRKQRAGKIKVETDRDAVVYIPSGDSILFSSLGAKSDLKALLRCMFLLSPIRPHRLLQKLFQNLTTCSNLRHILTSTFLKLLHDDSKGALDALETIEKDYRGDSDWRARVDFMFSEALDDFPPPLLIGAAPEVMDTDGLNPNITLLRRKQTNDTAAAIAANLPMSAKGSRYENQLPPVVATRIVDTIQHLCKNSPRFCIDMLICGVVDSNDTQESRPTGFEALLDLLEKPRYSKSSANLEQLLTLLESAVSPLSHLAKHGDEEIEISQKDVDAAATAGKEWIEVPRIVLSQGRLQMLCSILRMETCRDAAFTKVNTIARRLCRIDANRGYILAELASVARALGVDAMRDLKSLSIRMSNAVDNNTHDHHVAQENTSEQTMAPKSKKKIMSASNSVAVSTSTSELKLLRVLQTLQALCADTSDDAPPKKSESIYVTEELVQLLRAMDLDELWAELTACLKVVQVLEGVNIEEDAEKKADEPDGDDGEEENGGKQKKLQNSVAGLLTRFLPSIEAFFVANASATRIADKEDGGKDDKPDEEDSSLTNLVGGAKLIEFVAANKVLLNALVRNNSSLLDKGLRALIQVPRCRQFLDFDVKRHWFKTQVRRLRQHASRRHGSLRLHIRRRHVFEDAYHQLRLRNAEEMRGRLHITFRNEEGVDAGGLSREFFGILAKEMFNPNYALFTSTEDGSTFQPNPNSSINPDHLSYFRFVGRIVGKAVADGYLLDAHFTRSLYKHMIGIKPTHHDMEAIDPDYYKNLKTILEYNLEDLGLEMTFSIEDHCFGRSRTVDLIPDGHKVPVTEQNKAKYVSLVCHHRMTTAISSQIKAYLDGFYELVSRDLIAIFTPRELELLISGLPDIDVHDLKQNTDYVGWKATDNQIQWFWNVLFSLSRNQKAAFLQFVTGSSKVPLAGFGELPGMRGVQKFSIHKASGSNGALVAAHTCFNSLDLPVYSSEEELKEKLLYAIAEGGGTFLLA